ncbi:MAG: PKD domain-containing protein [Thermoplasmatota archaeon]
MFLISTNGIAEILTVDSNNETYYSTIQQAIDNALDGDTIVIQKGSYIESIWINKSITIKGENKAYTIISPLDQNTFTINADDVILRNITITNSATGISLYGSHCTIANITFLDNDIGIMISNNSDNNIVYSNNFVNNTIHAMDHSSQNSWHSDILGNYWDEYTGTDTNNDGIGDTPYNITENASDLFPLISPVTTPPKTDFYMSPTNPTIESIISFTDLSIKTDNQIISWKWDFGDGNTSTEQNTTHQYDLNGLYLVSLTITDILGATDTQTYSLVIQNLPATASFTIIPETPMTTEEVNFIDTSTDKDGYIMNRTWNVNDSFYEHASSFQHTFIEKGVYKVTLTVTDNDNASSTIIKQITVLNTPPSANFFYTTKNDTYLIGSPVDFNDNSFDQDGVIISYHWDFGDGTTSTQRNPTHLFSSTGRHQVTLTVTDNDNDQDSITKSILIGSTNDEGFLSALSLFDILMVFVILSAVILVLIVSKKYSGGGGY